MVFHRKFRIHCLGCIPNLHKILPKGVSLHVDKAAATVEIASLNQPNNISDIEKFSDGEVEDLTKCSSQKKISRRFIEIVGVVLVTLSLML